MRITLRLVAFAALSLSVGSSLSYALSAEDIARAEKIITIVAKLNAKYASVQGTLVPPTPQADGKANYCCPYKADGTITEWANKAITAQLGAAVGEKAAEKASGAALSHVPVPGAGLLGGMAKKKGKQVGAIAALGGKDYIAANSDQSFGAVDDLAVYLHVKYSSQGNFSQALATAMTVYPDLEKAYDPAIRRAYEAAAATAKAQAAAKAAEDAKAAAAAK